MSLAPERLSIGITRQFTSPGVHPYDQVVWERRDARITNWKDGSVAFEQLDVEFPIAWSLNATNIVAQKYFRGTIGTPERETSLRQVIDRVADTITTWGIEGGYFAEPAEAETFRDELKFILVTQRAAFNSPVWFNIGVKGVPQQASACFILSVDDTMDGILNWYREEGIIFKGGSGSGVNLSKIRSSYELLNGGGTASGPVSFMRGADASAGTIKSGGKTRRAAKMVILNVDHPDVEEFVWCKAKEERKARVLRDAGFDMDLDGSDSFSIQYQNANNSVRISDDFMHAVINDTDWTYKAVIDGSAVRTVRARDLWRQIATASWECADPGLQFDTTINKWHTAHATGRINGSNPCFTGDTLVHTDKGLIGFADLLDRARNGEAFGVYTHDITNPDAPTDRLEVTTPDAIMVTGTNEIVRLELSNGMELRCTAGHRIFTANRGYVAAGELTSADDVRILNHPSPATHASWALPVSAEAAMLASGDRRVATGLSLPDKWTDELGHYLGWLVGDGTISGEVATTVYGSADDINDIMPLHRLLLTAINDGTVPKPSEQPNGTVQLRASRRAFVAQLRALGVSNGRATDKVVPWSVLEAPSEVAGAFLRGLFDADGCVYDGAKSRYVGLGSASKQLLQGAQRLLATLGVTSSIYATKGESREAFSYTTVDGQDRRYSAGPMFDLRISAGGIRRFADVIGFSVRAKADKLATVLSQHRQYAKDQTTAQLVSRTDDGVELTYNLSEPRNHSYVANGVVVRNCSEYMHLDNSACNLASINLLKYLDLDSVGDDSFDIEAYMHTVEVIFTAQEILVGRADYPTEPIGETSRKFRQLGIGYANLGALLMALGLPYDSVEGRAWAAALTSLMTGHAYATSARTASRMGPFAGFADNEIHMLNVLRMHRDESYAIDGAAAVPADLVAAGQQAWEVAVRDGEEYGVRNSQSSVLAPTGCLVGGSLVTTSRGLVRLGSLGDPDGAQWQDVSFGVHTDDGEREATKFYVNGLEQVVDVTTRRGYRIQGTTKHRVKVVDQAGTWVWRRFADLRAGDRVPLALGALIGTPNEVVLPPLSDKMGWAGERHVRVPSTMTPDLAELVGYFMGDGSLHSRGLRFCVDAHDLDVVAHLAWLGKELFGVTAATAERRGYVEVAFHSVRLADWWVASGFGKRLPHEGHSGKGYTPHIPESVLHTNDPACYRSFLRGLFEADGTVTVGYPSWTTTSLEFAVEVQSLMLALGFVSTRSRQVSGRGSALKVVRLLNRASNERWLGDVGFISQRKWGKVDVSSAIQSARYDHIPVSRELIDRAVPHNGRERRVALMEHARSSTITRRLAEQIYQLSHDAELGHLLGFFFDLVETAELGDEELTYDLSVPANVTYVANGFVSHNTIGLMMDCDTTGIEPDLGLCKMKKLVGGGTMVIVNQTIPRALRRLGYNAQQVDEIIGYIDHEKSILGAPHLAAEHVAVFACSMGDNTIHYEGHVRMMGATQPFLSGAISKTVNMPEEATIEDIEALHQLSWELGLKAVAVYRDNCKVGQPLSTAKKDGAPDAPGAEAAATQVVERIVERVVHQPIRQKLPRTRSARTFEFRVADCKGFANIGEYADGRPGEIFLTVSKQGSTLSGIMDAFAKSISYGLQYGVPIRAFVEAFTNMRFEPAGMTDDPDIRFASSIMDYLFRRLALEYLTYDERAELGIFSIDERLQPTLPGVEESVIETRTGSDIVADPKSVPSVTEFAKQLDLGVAPAAPNNDVTNPSGIARPAVRQSDAPMCMQCGVQMIRSGSCHACPSCGSTSGCS
ncbi:MAG: LAGLIDADG family homing endonuclease [Actinomycetota bacterium]